MVEKPLLIETAVEVDLEEVQQCWIDFHLINKRKLKVVLSRT